MLKISFPFIQVSRIIQASPETLWDLLTDTTRWTEWGPSIHQVQSSDRHIRAGSAGRVKTILGFWAPFVVNEWENQRYWSWRVFNIRATGHRIESINANCCRLIFEVPFWVGPYAVICNLAAKRMARLVDMDKF
jgi:hypothetical protein